MSLRFTLYLVASALLAFDLTGCEKKAQQPETQVIVASDTARHATPAPKRTGALAHPELYEWKPAATGSCETAGSPLEKIYDLIAPDADPSFQEFALARDFDYVANTAELFHAPAFKKCCALRGGVFRILPKYENGDQLTLYEFRFATDAEAQEAHRQAEKALKTVPDFQTIPVGYFWLIYSRSVILFQSVSSEPEYPLVSARYSQKAAKVLGPGH